PNPGYFGADSFTFKANNGQYNSAPATVALNVDVPGTATPVATDTSTQGNWVGAYGSDGYVLPTGSDAPPSYARVAFSGQDMAVWSSSTTDVRALQQPSSGRTAATWYSFSSFTVHIGFNDGQTHRVAAYLLDWDGGGVRHERVDVVDAGTGTT